MRGAGGDGCLAANAFDNPENCPDLSKPLKGMSLIYLRQQGNVTGATLCKGVPC